ncbi:p21-C-terminal region-binding protein-domain-containing protein [Cristinia sonorae]|uniref:Protein BCP1 n=1 Tax=Cristinia sonorae TaxID=1940300 RepID=A0A8K0UR20_9AGAR|nr:p21-C-terminal region-binding protein-domain-containing protein [Cristinia sonorae]
MSKRKQNSEDRDDDGSDVSLVDVDFDFFDPNPEIDYIALKRLAVQLFQGDAEALQVHDLTDLILSQPAVGTTIKCDGKESDPYSFLTVLNLHVHQARPFMKALVEYVLLKSSPDPAFHNVLHNLLGPAGLHSQNHLGFIFSERLINMPVQTVPPMYRMLGEEVTWALEENQPYKFSHLLFISRIYRLTAEEAAELEEMTPRSKRHKGSDNLTGGVHPFHPEDDVIAKFATHTIDYSFTTAQPREKDSFGLDLGGRMMLVPADRFAQLVTALNEAFPPP